MLDDLVVEGDEADAIAERCTASRIDYRMLNTSKPLDYALFDYLSIRERLMKAR